MNIHDHPTTGTRFTHLGIHRHIQHTWLDAQGILWPSECRITWRRSPLARLDPHHQQDIPILKTNQRNRKHHRGILLKGFPNIIPEPHKNFQPYPTTTDSGIVSHQTDSQRRYLLDIIASDSLDATKVISKYTATKKSGNWDRWFTLLTHSGIIDKCLKGIPQEHKTIIVSSFAASVQRNQFGTTKK